MKKLFFLLLVIGFGGVASSQYDDFDGLRSSGLLNADYLTKSSEKYYSDVENEEDFKQKSIDEQNAIKSFYLRTHFYMDQNLTNGTVLLNDETGLYLQKLLDKILVNQPDLRKQIRVYTARNPYVNAYATEQGLLLVNLGLLSKVRNEAELAFILAHEVVHFAESHNMSLAIEELNIEKEVQYMGRGSASEKLFRKHAYNRALETEADEAGLITYLEAGYSPQHAFDVFEVLDSASFPYSFRTVDLNVLCPDGFAYPDSISVVKPSKVVLVIDDELTTHPGTDDRRFKIKEKYEGEIPDEGAAYIVSKEEFLRTRDLARLEIARYLNSYGYFVTGFYHSYCMLQDFPDNPYLEKSLMESMYKMAITHNNGGFMTSYALNDQGIEDDLAEFFDDMRGEEMLIWAMDRAYKMKLKHPEDSYYKDVFIDLMKALIDETGYKIREVGVAYKSSRIFNGMDYLEKMSEDFEWEQLWRKAKDQLESEEAEELTWAQRRDRRKRTQQALRAGAQMNADSILVYNPFYYQADTRDANYLDFLGGEEREDFFVKTLKDYAEQFDRNLSFLDVHDFDEQDVDKVNDMILINDWMSDIDIYNESPSISIFESAIDSLQSKYDAKYLMTIGMFTERSPSYGIFGTAWFIPLIHPLGIPPLLYNSLKPKYTSHLVFTLYSFQEKDVVYSESRTIKGMKNKDQIIKHHLYDLIQSMSYE